MTLELLESATDYLAFVVTFYDTNSNEIFGLFQPHK
jgi:hypothetical protein